MSANFYSEIYLHIVWHTKQSLPLLNPQIEALTHRALKQKLVNWPGVYVHAIGGTETHVHLAISIPPTETISEMIGQLKGFSAFEVNRQSPQRDKLLQWQTGYGVVSFGAKDLPWVVAYIENQKQHHAQGDVFDRLERMEAIEAASSGTAIATD